MLSRKKRQLNLKESIEQSKTSYFDIDDIARKFDELPESSEDRFDAIPDKEGAIMQFRLDVQLFSENACLTCQVFSDGEPPALSPDSVFKYSPIGASRYESYHELLQNKKKEIDVFVLTENDTVIAYGHAIPDSQQGHIVEIIDVELVSRRTYGLKDICRIGQCEFSIGAAHVLVFAIREHYKGRLRTDATNASSRYAFKSAGFVSYNNCNHCLLESVA